MFRLFIAKTRARKKNVLFNNKIKIKKSPLSRAFYFAAFLCEIYSRDAFSLYGYRIRRVVELTPG